MDNKKIRLTILLIGFLAAIITIFSFSTGVTSITGIIEFVEVVVFKSPIIIDKYDIKLKLSKHILYGNSDQLFVISKGTKKIIEDEDIIEYQISPQLEKIAALSRNINEFNVHVINIDGSNHNVFTLYPHVNVFAKNLIWVSDKKLRISLTSQYYSTDNRLEQFSMISPGTYEINIDNVNSLLTVSKPGGLGS